jgi:hypothetical protein
VKRQDFHDLVQRLLRRFPTIQAVQWAPRVSSARRGWNPVPLSRETKKPIGHAWQHREITAETAARYFNDDVNVGAQMGPRSNGLTDTDLDCREAVAVASLLLPKTNAMYGRASKPRSHRLYVTGLADRIKKGWIPFHDVDGTNGYCRVHAPAASPSACRTSALTHLLMPSHICRQLVCCRLQF